MEVYVLGMDQARPDRISRPISRPLPKRDPHFDYDRFAAAAEV